MRITIEPTTAEAILQLMMEMAHVMPELPVEKLERFYLAMLTVSGMAQEMFARRFPARYAVVEKQLEVWMAEGLNEDR